MTSDRPVTLRVLEMASVSGFAIVCGALAMRLSSAPWERSQLLTMCVGAGLGYLLADVVSGVVHWFCDTFFHDDTPLIGSAFIHPFREHHADPLAITRHGFFEVNGNTCLALLPVVAAVLLLGRPDQDEVVPAPFAQSVALAFAVATFATNQFHKWAHQEHPVAAVRWLQSTGLILTPAHHRIHHSHAYRQAFCITAGWLDPLLDRVRLFERIEHAVRRWSPPAGRTERSSGRTRVAPRRTAAERNREN
jgi:sterol desaturase/sphingolipid hydroxylase (fatty acid hydroxylase superfamily)